MNLISLKVYATYMAISLNSGYRSKLAEQQPGGRWAAIRGSTGCINIQKHNYIADYI